MSEQGPCRIIYLLGLDIVVNITVEPEDRGQKSVQRHDWFRLVDRKALTGSVIVGFWKGKAACKDESQGVYYT